MLPKAFIFNEIVMKIQFFNDKAIIVFPESITAYDKKSLSSAFQTVSISANVFLF